MGFLDKLKKGAKKVGGSSKMSRKTYVVRYTGNKPNPWAIFTGKHAKPVVATAKKSTSKKRAINLAKKKEPSKVVVENRSGGIVDIREYGEVKQKTKTGGFGEAITGIEDDMVDLDQFGQQKDDDERYGGIM